MKWGVFILFAVLIIGSVFFVFFHIRQQQIPIFHALSDSVVAPKPTLIPCNGKPTIAEEEGPYYKEGSPQKSSLYNQSIPGKKFVLTGYVLDTNCNPLANVWLDFWQANGNGHYDNNGYTLRGHQYTDMNGKFTLTTVVPGEYPGRTPHIHVKVRASSSSPILTTQLYIPGLATNVHDAIYNPTLQMHNVTKTPDQASATFVFIVK